MKRTLHSLSIILLCASLQTSGFCQVTFKDQSALATGEWYKISVNQAGIYKVDYDFLTSVLGIASSTLNTAQIHVYGNRGGVLPQSVDAPNVDDLEEMATYRIGLDDGKFDPGDYLLFYGEAPAVPYLDPGSGLMVQAPNIYDSENHYFIGVLDRDGLQPELRPSVSGTVETTDTYERYIRYEKDRINLLGKYLQPGSGKKWFGDEFSAVRERDYSLEFDGIAPQTNVRFRLQFAGRSGISSNVFVTINGQEYSGFMSKTNLGDVEDPYARITTVSGEYTPIGNRQVVTIGYPEIPGANNTGWLDFIEMQASSPLTMSGSHLVFDLKLHNSGVAC